MTRYVRTKNKIIDLNRKRMDGTPIYNLDTKENVIKAYENKEERDCYYIENDTIYDYCYSDGCIWEEHILKQSSNLADLCDEFRYEYNHSLEHEMCWENNNTGIWFDNDTDIELCKEEVLTIKGAMWTDKGLIYVAKMNENGELVLI